LADKNAIFSPTNQDEKMEVEMRILVQDSFNEKNKIITNTIRSMANIKKLNI